MSAAGEGHAAAAPDGNMDPAGTAAADAMQCMSIGSEDKDGTLPDEVHRGRRRCLGPR